MTVVYRHRTGFSRGQDKTIIGEKLDTNHDEHLRERDFRSQLPNHCTPVHGPRLKARSLIRPVEISKSQLQGKADIFTSARDALGKNEVHYCIY